MVGGPTCRFRFYAFEAKSKQVQLFAKDVNDSDWIIFTDVRFQSFRKKNALQPALSFDKPLHRCARGIE